MKIHVSAVLPSPDIQTWNPVWLLFLQQKNRQQSLFCPFTDGEVKSFNIWLIYQLLDQKEINWQEIYKLWMT